MFKCLIFQHSARNMERRQINRKVYIVTTKTILTRLFPNKMVGYFVCLFMCLKAFSSSFTSRKLNLFLRQMIQSASLLDLASSVAYGFVVGPLIRLLLEFFTTSRLKITIFWLTLFYFTSHAHHRQSIQNGFPHRLKLLLGRKNMSVRLRHCRKSFSFVCIPLNFEP